jgi:alpha-L-fucosidase 2
MCKNESDKYILRFEKPADHWGESLLLGDGTLGAAVFGGIEKERIQLSHNTFFSGQKQHLKRENAPQAFKQMRQEMVNKNYHKAADVADDFIGIRGNYGSNLPVGEINIEFGKKRDVSVERYERSLNICQGVASIITRTSEMNIDREVFINNSDHGLYYRIKASNPTSCRISFENNALKKMIFVKEQQYYFTLKALEKIHSDGKNGVSLMGAIHVIECDGSVIYTDQGINVNEFTRCIIRLVSDTDFDVDAPDFISEVDRHKLAQVPYELDYDWIVREHKADIEQYMKRIDLSFGGDDDLSEFMLQYGRYLLLCSSREDSLLPAHLQGIWNDNVACQIGWTCDMHLDINTQMNYWLSEAGNLRESHKPLLRWMKDIVLPSGRKTAHDYYGLPGWSADLVSNAWGYTHPYWSKTISPCPTSGIWMASDFVEHYRYYPDLKFLGEEALPVIEEAVSFFVNYVFKREGRYSVGPSISPENSYIIDGKRYYFLLDSIYERLMICELFNQYLYLCEEIQMQGKYSEKVEEILSDFEVYSITEDGRIREFNDEVDEYDSQHRHTSHLLGLYPYRQITPEETPELAIAAYKSIQKRLNPYEQWEDTGWARSMLMLYMARLKKGDEAYWHIKEMYQNLLNPNRLVIHPPTRGADAYTNVYELDGNTGLAMCILEMLVQSHDHRIEVLPALPKIWKEGYINGIKTDGGVTIGLKWKESKLEYVRLMPSENVETNCHIECVYQGEVKSVQLVKGIETVIEYN